MRDLDFASYLALSVCFICYKKWVQREKNPNNTHLPYHILKETILRSMRELSTANSPETKI